MMLLMVEDALDSAEPRNSFELGGGTRTWNGALMFLNLSTWMNWTLMNSKRQN